jgi:hypothetical protein
MSSTLHLLQWVFISNHSRAWGNGENRRHLRTGHFWIGGGKARERAKLAILPVRKRLVKARREGEKRDTYPHTAPLIHRKGAVFHKRGDNGREEPQPDSNSTHVV